MDQEKIEYLKREIKRTYERYIGERTDEKATILDVAKFFNIPIDESRIEDYVVKMIDYNTPSIEVVDERNDISYNATYTGNAKIGKLDYGGPTEFNSVVSTSPVRKEEILYYIGSETPVVTKMTFTDGDYELAFECEMPNSIGFINDGIKMVVEYSQNVNYDGRNVKQPLFTRVYKNNYKNEELVGTFENEYTYGSDHFIKWEDSQDKYAYIRNNSVIYGINELERKDLCHYFRGICFESTEIPKGTYFPLIIKSSIFYKNFNFIFYLSDFLLVFSNFSFIFLILKYTENT